MLLNYLVSAWRHIIKNRLFSVINVLGLALGMASCILILLFVRAETGFDRWLPDSDRLVRLHSGYYPTGRPQFETVRSAGRMMAALRDYVPDIEQGVRLVTYEPTVLHGEDSFTESLVFADGTFFDIFALSFVHGDPASAFNGPWDLILTETTARKYFGRTDVVGESLDICCLRGDVQSVVVTGVVRDLPRQTHLNFDLITWLDPAIFADTPSVLETWTSVNTYTYFRLTSASALQDAQDRVNHWLDNESPHRDMTPEGAQVTDFVKMKLMPVPDLHLEAARDAGAMGDLSPMGDGTMVRAFAGIAVLILLIASINFMNLSTARASHRSREVALRKVMGASRWQVGCQFVGEALLIAFAALVFALAAVEIALPAYNDALGMELTLSLSADLPLVVALLVLTAAVGVVSGSYPAIYLSGFLPTRILRHASHGQTGAAPTLRSALVLLQFAVSIVLAVCTAVVLTQTLYARSVDPGYTVNDKLILDGIARTGVDAASLRDRLARLPGVESVVLSSEAPTQDHENNTFFRRLGDAAANDDGLILNYHHVDYGFFAAYNMQLITGREFDRRMTSDQLKDNESDVPAAASVVLNESAVRQLGYASPDAAIGQIIRADVSGGLHDLTIVGVARDVYFRSIRFGIRPSVFLLHPDAFRVATVTFTGAPAAIMQTALQAWRDAAPQVPADARFLSDMVQAQYAQASRQAQLLGVFTLLAALIACLGLYGLATFATERRTREIGIRKVMGAGIKDIVLLLVWQFSRPVLLANAIAWPSAWFLMRGWLEGFEYRIADSTVLALTMTAGGVALLVAWLTVAGRAVRVARANPITALRYE